MKDQFNFDSTNAAMVLNGLLNLKMVWQDVPEWAGEKTRIEHEARVAAYDRAYHMVLESFKTCGLEILELQAKEV
jgi:hypothetical protein